jgi:hypothetical protein
MANRRVGGVLLFKLDGQVYLAKGNFEYDIGAPKRDAVVGADSVHGFKEMPKVPFISGAITDTDETDLEALLNFRDGTATLELANGKVIVIREAYYAGDGNVSTEEGEIPLRIEGIRGEEVS